jgi:hypothetical protein
MKRRIGGIPLNSTDIKERRRFGIIAFVFFGTLFLLGLWTGKPVPIYLFGFLCLLGLGLICFPRTLNPVYLGWLKIAHFLGRVVTATILALAYYLIITPSAIIKRIFGGRPIQLKPDKDVPSYWVTRDEPVQPRERFVKRY